ncbi:MAG: DNA-directed RNA polymerase [Caldisphaera sp.]|uniref:zinc finger domain-containing protein n=1 Tax=Caldisphaera sp. TaxID=2060322 RepID=UPI000CC01274|nr:zinc finger domain-containing protein [Caldisphaera sp.]PMP59878.1 MAG: DNA-directed RNA polymerase [Caldisphaera sp.]PMP91125.1 MAG: DNA-directed RNA polymerase [Caldisphaera sp.]
MSEEENMGEPISEEVQQEEYSGPLYGIKEREVYYMCLNCGYKISKTELDQYHSMICPKCGYRVFIKLRAPPTLVKPRKVDAI